jgi:type VII secretion protein EccB
MPPQTQNRRDLLQAYRLMTQRTALALIAGEPDSPNQPLRRRNMATVSGVLAGVIACAVFGVLGMLSPGPVSGLTKAGTLVIDKDTATPYVPCRASGQQKLCPALNYASALLALDTTGVNRVDVTQSTLANYKIGPTVGIAGLPQDLPISTDLIKGPWSVCADAGISTLVGGAAVGGTAITTQYADLVNSEGQNWVLWDGRRMKIPNKIMTVLWPSVTPQTVSTAWLNALPEVPDFTPPVITGEGTTVRGPNGTNATVGQVFSASTAQGPKDYVLDQEGKLDPITQVQAELLEFEANGAPEGQQQIAPSTAAEDVGTPVPAGNLPSTLPKIPRLTSPVCVSYGAGMNPTITAGGTIPANATPTGNGSPTTVDRVWLPQGHGALIGVTASTDRPPVKTWFLLDGATRYGLSSSEVAYVLGYNLKQDETVLPASLVDLLPMGPALDPTQIKQQLTG